MPASTSAASVSTTAATDPLVSQEEADRASAASISWAHLVRRHAHLLADKAAVRFEDQTLTFAQLDQRIDTLAAAFHERGVRPGDRVAIVSGNRPEFLEAIGAATRLGAIAVPINFRLVASEIAFILHDSDARLVVTDAERAAVVNQAQITLGRDLPTLVVAPQDDHLSSSSTEDYETALQVSSGHAVPVSAATIAAWRAESPALILYTSGTTGTPKGAVLAHLNLFVQTLTHVRVTNLVTDDEVTLCVPPIFHVAGIGSVIPSLIVGCTLVLVGSGPFQPEHIADLVDAEQITSMFLVPSQWQALCSLPDIDRRGRSLRTISWGASPAAPSTLKAMTTTFPHADIVAMFGQTEMSPVTASLEGKDAIDRSGSVGRPVATVDIRVVDDDMHDVGPGDIGEIVYRGPTTMAGYWNNPSATAEATRGGWFHPGDLVQVDDHGHITVVDRSKDMIISGGENIYSSEVETAIDGHPAVKEVAVVAGPHERYGETPVAVIVPVDPARPPTHADIVEWVSIKLASYKKPTSLRIVDELPRNASGKVLKHQLRQHLDSPNSNLRTSGVCNSLRTETTVD